MIHAAKAMETATGGTWENRADHCRANSGGTYWAAIEPTITSTTSGLTSSGVAPHPENSAANTSPARLSDSLLKMTQPMHTKWKVTIRPSQSDCTSSGVKGTGDDGSSRHASTAAPEWRRAISWIRTSRESSGVSSSPRRSDRSRSPAIPRPW